MRELVLVRKLNLKLVLASDVLYLNVRIQSKTQCPRGTLERLWKRLALSCLRLIIDRKERGEIFCLTDRQFLINNFLGKLDPSLRRRNGEYGPSMTSSDQPILNELLNLFRKVKEPQRVRHSGARFRDKFSDFILGERALLDELLIATGLFQRAEVRPLEVLDQCKLEDLCIRDLLDDHRHLFKARKLSRLIPSLSSHYLVLSALLPNEERLKYSVLLD